MGVRFNFTCRTCRKTFQLGYGSYKTWIVHSTIESYDADERVVKYGDLFKNKNLRQCLVDHDGHDFVIWNNDFHSLLNSDLVCDATMECVVEGVEEFEKIDMLADVKSRVVEEFEKRTFP